MAAAGERGAGDPSRATRRQIWWVVRTRSSFVVEKVKPLYVTAPTCDFDVVGQVYEEFVALR